MEALGKNTAEKGKACQNGRLFSLISLVVPRHLPGGISPEETGTGPDSSF